MKSLQNSKYPRQFWLLFWAFFVNRASNALIWPFLTITMHQRLDAPLTTITLLISIEAAAGLLATSAIGLFMDKFGRKNAMVISLIGSSVILIAMSTANSLLLWAILLALYGALSPIFYVGANAMVADLVQSEHRSDAYALMRMIMNLGIAIGPIIGGFIMVYSDTLTFNSTAIIEVVLAVFVIFLIRESLPAQTNSYIAAKDTGYVPLLRDREFLTFCATYTLIELAASLIFVLLPVYMKDNFAIPENQFGLLLTVNAGIIVLCQYHVMRYIERFNQLPLLAVGALFYAMGLVGIGLSNNFLAFAISIIVLTIGEMIVVPVATVMVADMSPSTMRARYMGVYSLTYTVASGVGPVMGGVVNDHIAPRAIWYTGALVAMIAAGGFMMIGRWRGLEYAEESVQKTVAPEF